MCSGELLLLDNQIIRLKLKKPPYYYRDASNIGAPQGGSGAMFYVQNSLACYVLCKF